MLVVEFKSDNHVDAEIGLVCVDLPRMNHIYLVILG